MIILLYVIFIDYNNNRAAVCTRRFPLAADEIYLFFSKVFLYLIKKSLNFYISANGKSLLTGGICPFFGKLIPFEKEENHANLRDFTE